MSKQSITLANQNDEWLKQQVAQEEFSSKSEAINYLIKQAREREAYKVVLVQKPKRNFFWR
jgi:antitoxin ParD1/3/4